MRLLIAVCLDVMLRRLRCMVSSMRVVPMCQMRLMGRLFVISGLVMFSSFAMMTGCVFVVLSSVMVVFTGLF